MRILVKTTLNERKYQRIFAIIHFSEYGICTYHERVGFLPTLLNSENENIWKNLSFEERREICETMMFTDDTFTASKKEILKFFGMKR